MRQQRLRRRAVMYVALLMTALIVAVIGVSGLTLGRIQLRAADGGRNVVAARVYAQSAIELALLAINADLDWRTTYANDTLVPTQSINDGVYTWKLVDEQDGDLANDPDQPVRLYGVAVVGEAVRTYSVLLEPPPPNPNLLSNGNMENGTTDWYGFYCDIASYTDDQHGGAASVAATGRDAYYSGPAQTLTNTLESGTTYVLEAWARMDTGTSDVRFVMFLQSSFSGTAWLVDGETSVGSSAWTRVAGTMTPAWSGFLMQAFLKVSTASGTTDFYVDDVSLRVAPDDNLVVVPGTWRREVNP